MPLPELSTPSYIQEMFNKEISDPVITHGDWLFPDLIDMRDHEASQSRGLSSGTPSHQTSMDHKQKTVLFTCASASPGPSPGASPGASPGSSPEVSPWFSPRFSPGPSVAVDRDNSKIKGRMLKLSQMKRGESSPKQRNNRWLSIFAELLFLGPCWPRLKKKRF